MLTLITEQFLADPRLQQNVCMTEKCRQLWNHLGALWMCIVLNPSCQPSGKESWRKQLQQWSDLDVCPLNDEDCLGECNDKQTVFSGAIAACELNWESGVLQKILKGEADGVSWLGKGIDDSLTILSIITVIIISHIQLFSIVV